MLYNAVNGSFSIGNATMDYIRFGKGKKNIVMIPGLGDGLRTVKGMALPFAAMYRKFAKDYTVWVFGRKQPLETDATTRSMAADLKQAMDGLGIEKAGFIGVSQGGMIAQYMAIDYPECVDKLALVVTLARQNDTMHSVINYWTDLVQKGDYKTMTIDNFEKSYSEGYLKKYRPLYPLIVLFMKPADSDRFLVQAKSCVEHNAFDELDKITCPTLIIAGQQDKIVTPQASVDMAKAIKGAKLITYADYGHALYEEASNFNDVIIEFMS